MFCPQCGTDVGRARFCPACGSPVHGEGAGSRGRHVGPGGGRYRSVAPIALAGAAVGVVIVLIAVIVVMLREDGEREDSDVAARGGSPPTAEPSPSATPETATRDAAAEQPSATPTAEGRDVRTLPAGLFCRDLDAQGYSYTAAVDYWRLHGQPNQMDADGNGIPCETVYPAADVAAHWQPQDVPLAGDPPPGLFCRDLYARGFTYPEAVAYWWADGAPGRMDADSDGIPCETVYPAEVVNAFWVP
jgi:hypothetical protein